MLGSIFEKGLSRAVACYVELASINLPAINSGPNSVTYRTIYLTYVNISRPAFEVSKAITNSGSFDQPNIQHTSLIT
jgi:hypothetical protein